MIETYGVTSRCTNESQLKTWRENRRKEREKGRNEERGRAVKERPNLSRPLCAPLNIITFIAVALVDWLLFTRAIN